MEQLMILARKFKFILLKVVKLVKYTKNGNFTAMFLITSLKPRKMLIWQEAWEPLYKRVQISDLLFQIEESRLLTLSKKAKKGVKSDLATLLIYVAINSDINVGILILFTKKCPSPFTAFFQVISLLLGPSYRLTVEIEKSASAASLNEMLVRISGKKNMGKAFFF